MKPGLCLLFLFLAGCLAVAEPPAPASRTNVPPAALPKVSKPSELPKGLQLERGFRIEQVAAEPLISAPIAMAFDENGRLFVLEKSDQTNSTATPSGRVRLLEDTDGDGIFDTSAVYADKLSNPTALLCYGNGVFVAGGGQIQYLRDTAFDGTADVHRDVFKSLGAATNGTGGQVLITSLVWGLDNRIHVSTAGQGGDIISSSSPVQSIVLSGGNFSFDPRSFRLAAESGYSTGSLCFDNRGRIIVAGHDQPLQMIMYDARYAARNPLAQMPGALLNLTSPGTPERQLTADSMTIYRGNAYPADYAGDVFIADATREVVRRVKLRQHGVELTAENPPAQAAAGFLSARDPSFQIVQILNGPDGTLYLAAVMRAGTNTTKTNASAPRLPARGFIYRIVPLNFKQPKAAQMTRATSDQLVLMLRHPNGWLADTAARLLYERQDRTAVAPLVRLLFDTQAPQLARMHALHSLDGLHVTADGRVGNPLTETHVLKGLTDADDRVREHAVLLAERFITAAGGISDALWGQLSAMSADASPQVRYQLAFTVGQIRHEGRGPVLAGILKADPASRWMQAAVASSLGEDAVGMLGPLVGDAQFRNQPGGDNFLAQLYNAIGSQNQPADVAQALGYLEKIPEPQIAFSLARAFDNSLQRAGSSLAAADSRGTLFQLYENAGRVALDNTADESTRILALRLLSGVDSVDPGFTVTLLQIWPMMKPRLRREAIVVLLNKQNRTTALLQSMEMDWVSKWDVSSAQLRYLYASRDPLIAARVAVLYGKGPDNRPRQAAVNLFLPALQMTGHADKGRGIFLNRCATCHQFNGEGNSIGENLADAARMEKEKLLAKIVDPNREPPASYPATYVEAGGETLTGYIAAESPASITLCDAVGAERIVGRANIRSRVNLGFSTMPDGLETGLSQQDMADLIAFITGQ